MDETGSPGRPRTLSLGRAGIALARPHFSRQSQATGEAGGAARGAPGRAARAPRPVPRRDAQRAGRTGKPRRALRRTSPGSSGINETTAGHLRALSKLHFQGSFPKSRAHGTLSPQGRGEAGSHGTQFGKGRARPGRGAVRVPASLLRAASRLLDPAGCGPACATAAWSPRSWRGRSSRSSRAPCSRACSMSSSSVSPPLGVPPVGAGDPPRACSARPGVLGKGEEAVWAAPSSLLISAFCSDRADPAAGGKRCLEGGGEASPGPRVSQRRHQGPATLTPHTSATAGAQHIHGPGHAVQRGGAPAGQLPGADATSPRLQAQVLEAELGPSTRGSSDTWAPQGHQPKPQPREGAPDPPSPLLLPSLGTRKAITEKPLGGREEMEDHHAERPVGYGTSPVAKISPGASLPEPRAPDMPCESPKRSLQADRLCHLNRHLALPRGSPHRGPQAPATAPSGPQPQGLKAREVEAWEEPAGLLGLPGALAGVRDPRLEGALHLLLAQQLWARGRAGGAGLRGPPVPGKTPPSPPAGSHSEGPGGGAAGAALPRGQHPQPAGPGSPGAKEATATQDYVPDKPLDLSEWGRGREGAPKPASLPGSLSPPGAHTPSPKPPQGVEPSAQSGVQGLSDGTKGAKEPEVEEPPPSTVRDQALLLASTRPTQSTQRPWAALLPLFHQPAA
eukprot:bmy_16432T0